MKTVLISACLAGINCKYSGGNNQVDGIKEMMMKGQAIPVCPKTLGGLEVPRKHCEIIRDPQGDIRVMSQDSSIIRKKPSCGIKQVYDGSFKGKLIDGMGLTTQRLLDKGIKVMDAKTYLSSIISISK